MERIQPLLENGMLTKLKQYLHYDVVDGYVNQLDEIANETHDGKTYGGGYGNLLEFCKKICAF